ncbi:MAG: Serine/threonine-protein kinase PknB, partial [Planctomycetota bacterium]
LGRIEPSDRAAASDFYPQHTLRSRQPSEFELDAMSCTSSLDQTANHGQPLAISCSTPFLANREVRTDTTIVPEDITAIQPIAPLIGPVVRTQPGTDLNSPSRIRGALAKSQGHRSWITLVVSVAIALIGWGVLSDVEHPVERVPASRVPASSTPAIREISTNGHRVSPASDLSTSSASPEQQSQWVTTADTSMRSSPPPLASAPFDGEQAKALQEQWAQFLHIPVEWTGPYGIVFRLIPPGSFFMGSEARESDLPKKLGQNRRSGAIKLLMLQSETPQHFVTIHQPFYLSVTEVTVEQFARYVCNSGAMTDAEREGYGVRNGMRGEHLNEPGLSWHSPPQRGQEPVGYLSWNDARAFCEFLSQKSAGEFRLPTEAEWEYACRAGTNTRFHYGDAYRPAAKGRRSPPDHEQQILPPNAFGLLNLHSGVNELCLDEFSIGAATLTEDLVLVFGSERNVHDVAARYRVVRGNVTSHNPLRSQASARGAVLPEMRHAHQGVRVAASIETVMDSAESKAVIAAQTDSSSQMDMQP